MPQPVHAQLPSSQMQPPQPLGEGQSKEELHPGSGVQPPALPLELELEGGVLVPPPLPLVPPPPLVDVVDVVVPPGLPGTPAV